MEIFLSRPTWVSDEFKEGLSVFITQLNNLGLNPRTLGVSDYAGKAPLDEVIEILNSCKGAVILGYPQIEVQSGILKGQEISDPLHLSTEWNHLEAGLAYSMGLPLLVIHHTTVQRGIFDRGVLNAFLHSVDLTSSNWSMQEALNGAINNWKNSCINGIPNFIGSSSQRTISDNPQCPNCSTNQKTIYLSKTPTPIEKIEGHKWMCTKCGYMKYT